jgi:prophage regulatory protein
MTAASNNSATPTDDGRIPGTLQFLRIRDVCQMLRISKPTLWRLRRSPDFPVPTQLSDRAIGWSRDDIQTWVAARRQRPASAARSRT